ncbi:MAG: VCBS repeat-containing protein [Bacteroidota bacterium]
MKNCIPQLIIVLLLISSGCSDNGSTIQEFELSGKKSEEVQLLELVDAEHSGITFNNRIVEDLTFNYLTFDGVYLGAGVAVGDINNDGLQDIFFVGNMTDEKLYLNKGDMKFEDITAQAQIPQNTEWSSGVVMADVNNDGWLDIYVCNFLVENWEYRKNKLYINNGDLTFTEKGEEYGVADYGYSISANFFDYDKDGDLDLYVANQPPNETKARAALKGKKDFRYTDNLYRNEGNGKFTNVTKEAGVMNYSYSLSATVGDLDQDGWPDLYVACDYEEQDMMYRNNGDGTFTDIAADALRHMSNFSMGADIADINNDGWLDIYTTDMVAADNVRLKTNMSGMNPEKFWSLANNGYHHQYMFNALQLNNGNGTFSEIAQLSGISNTDWSWTPFFVDFDNDGLRDLMVTNGVMRDMRNNDFNIKTKKYVAERKAEGQTTFDHNEILTMAPSVKLSNYLYRNKGDLTFEPIMKQWGFDQKNWSQGAAYADFDNDGDVDMVLNNMNQTASLYRNTATDKRLNNYLRLKVEADQGNRFAFGAVVKIYYGDEQQIQEVTPMRGYMSCSENLIHFGLGKTKVVDRLEVTWLDGSRLELQDVNANQLLTVNQKQGTKTNRTNTRPRTLLADASKAAGINFKHQENDFDDFADQILLPYKMSHLGPCLARADVNGDGQEDVFIGGAAGQASMLYLQTSGGRFTEAKTQTWTTHKVSEDVGATFFDADGDGDQDLYVVSGGNEFSEGAAALQDRLYLNDGQGQFADASNRLPKMRISGSTAAAADFDGDGDQDLFVGGRLVPSKYGFVPRSYLLQNNNGKFTNITESAAPDLVNPGMVTDALWMDFDGDQDEDLILVGEWMPLSFFENKEGQLGNVTEAMDMANTTGWWNCISAADFDGDGDQDLVAGNLGLNIKYKASEEQPFKVYVKDFDENGSNDVYLGYYDQDGVCYPVRGRECSSQQLPYIKKEFKTYDDFANASIEKILGERKDGAVYHEAKVFTSMYIENQNGVFHPKALPNEAQISPIFGTAIYDWNGDGYLDMLVAGNYYQREVETTRSDAGIGRLLLGDGKGNFEPMPAAQAGLRAYKDVRAVGLVLDDQQQPMVLIANNDDALEVYKVKKEGI